MTDQATNEPTNYHVLGMEQDKTKSPKAPSKKKEKPEGGLEVVIDRDPYLRVRVRRCNMGRETIIKEESEALIIKMITTSMRGLDNDYKVLMKLPLGSFVNK